MAKSKMVKYRAQAGQASRRVVKAADRTSSSTAKSGNSYASTRLGAECGKLKGEKNC
jgi:hypothetical protein